MQFCRAGDRGAAAGEERAAVAQAFSGGDLQLAAAANAAAVFDAAVGGDGYRAGLGADVARVAHADARLGADQADFTGIHAAEAGDVQRHLRTRSGIVALFRDLLMRRIHLVASGGDVQILSPDAGVDFHRAGDNVGVVLARAVHARAFDRHLAAFDVKTGEVAVIHLRLAGGKRGAVGVDKSAAVAGDAGRVSDHHLRFLSRHFDKAVQAAGIARVNLVEDHFGLAAGEPGVAAHHAAQLGLHVFVGVVENGALLPDVELAVAVARHAAGGRGLNIDLRRAVGAVDNGRLLTARRLRVGDDGGAGGLDDAHRQPEAEAQRANPTD